MPMTLYDALIPTYRQVLGSVDRLVAKAEGLVDARLAPDMLPFGYQAKSCVAHSIGAIDGVRTGVYSPDMTPWPSDVAGLRAALGEAMTALDGIDAAAFEELGDKSMVFRMGEMEMPFAGRDFLLSFAQPNFHFHASIAYAILRANGVAIGKRDYLGQLRLAA